jgi:hypothetical protein
MNIHYVIPYTPPPSLGPPSDLKIVDRDKYSSVQASKVLRKIFERSEEKI